MWRNKLPADYVGPAVADHRSPMAANGHAPPLPQQILLLQRYAGNAAVVRLYRDVDTEADPVVAELRELNGAEIGVLLQRLATKSSDDLVTLQGKLDTAGIDVPRMRLAIKVCSWRHQGITEQAFVEIQPLLVQLPIDQQDVVARWVGLTGLAVPSRIDAYIAGATALRDQWMAKSTAQERVELLKPLLNATLQRAGVPPPKDYRILAISSGGEWNPVDWVLNITDALGSMTASEEVYARLLSTLLHEARHSEQTFLVARLLAGQGLSPEGVMGIPSDIADAARAAGPLVQGSAEETLAKQCYDSEYGSGAAAREAVLSDIPARNEEYRNLPEERDAHAVGNRVHDGLVSVPPNRDLDAGTPVDPVAGIR